MEEKKVIVSVPMDERKNRWFFVNPPEEYEYGLKLKLTPEEFETTLKITKFRVDSKDYSEHGLRGMTRHVMSGNMVMGQIWYSQEEYDEYHELNRDAW